MSFAQLALPTPFLDVLVELGYVNPSPIQEKAIPFLMEGQDLLGQAQTGTGKTAAFALPLLSKIELQKRSPQVLVLTPTRELAIQVSESFQSYAKYLKGFRVLPIYGGQSYTIQLKGLKSGVHVVVGTPGRLLDHLERGSLKFNDIRTVVLDEADEMLRMGFIEDVEKIVAQAPKNCQMAMFSATMPDQIRRITKLYLKNPKEIKIESKTTTVANVRQRYVLLSNEQKLDTLARFLEAEAHDGVLVFVRTKASTVVVAEQLEARGFAVSPLNGDLNQALRERTINRLKEKKVNIVVATDVAARGLDVEKLGLVVNYDIPQDAESYIHRIGRTGRAGCDGNTILFVTHKEKRLLRMIEIGTNQKIEQAQLPTSQDLEKKRASLFKDQILQTFAKQPLHYYSGVLEQVKQELNLSLEELAPVLLYLAQKDQPLQVKKSSFEQKPLNFEPVKTERTKEKYNSRPAQTEKFSKAKKPRLAEVDFDNYRLEVGKQHQIRVSDIVGAIANEVGIDSKFIGNIKLYDQHSTVELPKGMPKEIYQHLKKVYIRQNKMSMSLLS
ncbi:DEAD/DEAH box helicase [Deltaproteobacteria bacterium TL4]